MGQERRLGRRPRDILELALQLPVLGLELDDLHVDPLDEALGVLAPLRELLQGGHVRLGKVALHQLQARRDLLGEDVELAPLDLIARPRHRRRMVDHGLEAVGALEVGVLQVLNPLRVDVELLDDLAESTVLGGHLELKLHHCLDQLVVRQGLCSWRRARHFIRGLQALQRRACSSGRHGMRRTSSLTGCCVRRPCWRPSKIGRRRRDS